MKTDLVKARSELLGLASTDPALAAKKLNDFAAQVSSLQTDAGGVLRDVFVALTEGGMERSALRGHANIAKFMRKDEPEYKSDTEQALAELKFPRLSAKAPLEKKLVAFIQANAGEGRYFDDLDSGNNGVHAFVFSGAAAQDFVRLAGRGDAVPYDAKKHVVAALLYTNDEPEVKALVLDKATFRPVFVEHLYMVNVDEDELPKKYLADSRIKVDGYVDGFRATAVALSSGKELALKYKDRSNASWGIESFFD